MASIHAHSPSRRLQMVVLVGTVLAVAVFTVGSYLTSPVVHAHARVVAQSADSGPAPTVRPGPQPGETLVTLPNCVQAPDELVVGSRKVHRCPVNSVWYAIAGTIPRPAGCIKLRMDNCRPSSEVQGLYPYTVC